MPETLIWPAVLALVARDLRLLYPTAAKRLAVTLPAAARRRLSPAR